MRTWFTITVTFGGSNATLEDRTPNRARPAPSAKPPGITGRHEAPMADTLSSAAFICNTSSRTMGFGNRRLGVIA